MTVLLTDEGEVTLAAARAEGERLWVDAAALEAATGWSLRPEGLCRGAVCVPIPPARKGEIVRGADVDLAAVWRHLGHPVAHDETGAVWALGEGAAERAASLRSLEAPDFTLPDVAGRPHALSDYRGTKVLLISWASW